MLRNTSSGFEFEQASDIPIQVSQEKHKFTNPPFYVSNRNRHNNLEILLVSDVAAARNRRLPFKLNSLGDPSAKESGSENMPFGNIPRRLERLRRCLGFKNIELIL